MILQDREYLISEYNWEYSSLDGVMALVSDGAVC